MRLVDVTQNLKEILSPLEKQLEDGECNSGHLEPQLDTSVSPSEGSRPAITAFWLLTLGA